MKCNTGLIETRVTEGECTSERKLACRCKILRSNRVEVKT